MEGHQNILHLVKFGSSLKRQNVSALAEPERNDGQNAVITIFQMWLIAEILPGSFKERGASTR